MKSIKTPTEGAYQFELGETRCTVIVDGSFVYPHPAALFFATAPEGKRNEALRRYGIDPGEWPEVTLPYHCLLVEHEAGTVLVDTGAGDIAPTTGNLPYRLADLGLEPADIDVVVVSHAHPDHIGGLVTEGDPTFPTATHYIPAREYEYWHPEPDLTGLELPTEFLDLMASTAAANLEPVATANGWREVTGEQAVHPAVTVVPAPGHTPGHAAVSVTSAGEELLHLVDTVIHPLHIEWIRWAAGFDHHPNRVADTRRKLLEMAAEADLSMVTHFPEPGLGRVAETDEGFTWQPIR